jgi:pyruvate/2-oxoglutarate dehydrogenase complex dihydrolipoamide dehydrogenase (E3) component
VYIVINGGGKVASHLAQLMVEHGHDVAIIERRDEIVERLVAELPDELLVMPEFPRMPGGVKVNRYSAGGVVELASSSTEKQRLTRGDKEPRQDQ